MRVKARQNSGKGADCKEKVKEEGSAGKEENCKICVKRRRNSGKAELCEDGVKRQQEAGKVAADGIRWEATAEAGEPDRQPVSACEQPQGTRQVVTTADKNRRQKKW